MHEGSRASLAVEDSAHESRSAPPGPPPIVFLHGAAWAAVAWRRHIPLFKGRRCLAVDLPAHGRSWEQRWSTFDDVADLVAETVRGRTSEPVDLVGFSLGADVGIRLLARHPTLVRTAVLTGISAEPVSRLERILDACTWPLAALPLTRDLMAVAMRLDAAAGRDFRRHSRPMRISDYSRLSRQVLRGTALSGLADVPVPALILAGARESSHARRSALLVTRSMSSGVSATIPNARHAWPVHSPGLLASIVAQWGDEPGVVPSAIAQTA